MDISSLIRIERLNYVFGGILVVAAFFVAQQEDAFGVLVGAIISSGNFSFMRQMVERWMKAPPESRGPQAFLLLPKMAVLMGVVFVAMYFLPISGLGMIVGFSVFLLSIAIETVRYISRPRTGQG